MSAQADTAKTADEGIASDVAVPLVMSRWLQVEQVDATVATLYLQSTGKRLRVPRPLYDLLRRFQAPATLREVAGADADIARMVGAIRTLRAKGFLLAEGEAEAPPTRRLLTDPPIRLFDCPAQTLVPALANVVAIGVPCDTGDRASAGARAGPAALREASMQTLYGIDRATGQSQGWFDVDRGRAILRGVSVCDGGDVFVDHGERQAAVFDRLSEALEILTAAGALPVLLGGDASICWPALRLLQSRAPLAVVRIGVLGRRDAVETAPSAFVGAHALPRSALGLPGVSRYVHVGPCAAGAGASLAGFAHVPVEAAARDGAAALAPHLLPGQRIYLGVDMAALATPASDADGVALFDYARLHALVCGIGAAHPIAGLDLVGLNPSAPCWRTTAMTALHLLLTALSAAKDPHAPQA
ncbi:MAG: hypothetical protein HOP03_06910 [Lysobacter sp.]|nr:hypothetical protein [Lysobacter sp.]